MKVARQVLDQHTLIGVSSLPHDIYMFHTLHTENFVWIEIQFYGSTRCHYEYHIMHSGIDRSTLVCHL